MMVLLKSTNFCGSRSLIFSTFLISYLSSCQWLPTQEKESLASSVSTDTCQSSIEDLNEQCIIQIGAKLSDSELVKFVLSIKKRNPRALGALAHRAEQTLSRDLVVAKVGSSLGEDYTLAMSHAFLLFKKLVNSPEKWEKIELNDTASKIFPVGKGLVAYQSKSKEIVLVNTNTLERIKTYKFNGTRISDLIAFGKNEFLVLEDDEKVSRWSSEANAVKMEPIQTYDLGKKGYRATLREISPSHFAVDVYDVSWKTLSLFNVKTGARQDIDIKDKYYELTKIGGRHVVILGQSGVVEGKLMKIDVESGMSESFDLGVKPFLIIKISDIGNGLLLVYSQHWCDPNALVVNVTDASKVLVGKEVRVEVIRGTDFAISKQRDGYTLFNTNPWQQKQSFSSDKRGHLFAPQVFLGYEPPRYFMVS